MTKQKTPMQQLLEKLNHAKKQLSEQNERSHDYNKGYDNGYYDCLTNIINDIELQMIPIEQTVICEAFACGFNRYSAIGIMTEDVDYYNEKFGKTKAEFYKVIDIKPIDTTAHLVNKHGELDNAGAYAEDDKD